MKSALILVWFYLLTLLQLSHPFDITITGCFVILYSLLYLGLSKHLLTGNSAKLISLGAFTLTFIVFWTSIIHILFFFNSLYPGANPISFFLHAVVACPLYVLFYTKLNQQQPATQVREEPVSKLHFILEITFPLMVSISVFITTLLLSSSLQLTKEHGEGLTMLFTITAATVMVTVLATYLFEKWLTSADRKSMEKILLVMMIVGICFTLLLAGTRLP